MVHFVKYFLNVHEEGCTILFFFFASKISLMSLCICSIVECLFLNPYWRPDINLSSSIVAFRRSYIIFSSILEHIGSSDIGL